MKNSILTVLFSFAFFVSYAQADQSIWVADYEKIADSEILVSVKTDASFIVGANRYVLHIGMYHFLKSFHPDGRLDEIKFLLSVDAFNLLKDGDKITLVYGLYQENIQQDGEAMQSNGFTGLHWKLGTFSPSKLMKK